MSHSELCKGCGAKFDKTVSTFPCQAYWLVSFPLQFATKLVYARTLHPEMIVSRLSKQLGGRVAHSLKSYQKIGAQWGHIKIFNRDYKPTWIIKVPRQRNVACNPTISSLASNLPNKEVQGLFEKGAICELGYKKGSILFHTLQYSNLKENLMNGDKS